MDPDTGAQNEQHPHSNHQGSDADPTHLQSNALTSSSFSTHNQARADDFKLVQAARSGDLALLKLALKNGASVKDYGPEALREAAGSGNIEILGALLEAGVNPKECPRIVLEAVKTGRLDIVQLIVRSGADVNDYSSPLREAVRSNKKDMVEFLLESGAGKDRWNAISILENAAVFADLPILKLLIDSGRMKSSLDPALFLSVSHGRLDSASLLLENGASMERIPGGCLRRVLDKVENFEPIFELVKAHSGHIPYDVQRARYKKQPTVLSEQVRLLESTIAARDVGALKRLLEKAPELKEPHFRPLEKAADAGATEIVRYLLESGVAANENEGFPLIAASEQGYLDIVEILVAHGADVKAQHNAALIDACKELNAGVVSFLLSHGADPKAHKSQGINLCLSGRDFHYTPIRALEVAKLLIDSGADLREYPSLVLGHRTNAAEKYLHYLSAIAHPSSAHYLKIICPEIGEDVISFNDPNYHKKPIFRYISNCALVAAILEGNSPEASFFIELVKDGVDKVIQKKECSFKELAQSTTAVLAEFQGLRDVVDSFLDHALIPALFAEAGITKASLQQELSGREPDWIDLRKALYPLASEILFSGRSLGEILRFNTKWHRTDKQIPLDALPLKRDIEWYPIIPEVTLAHGFTIVALTTDQELRHHGAILRTCVGSGSYAWSCADGRTNILSLVKNGEPVAMLEVEPKALNSVGDGSLVGLSVKQFRGPDNAHPQPEHESQLTHLMHKIRIGEVSVKPYGLGETEESKTRRSRANISQLEALTGIPLGEFPHAALQHFRQAIFITRPNKTSSEPQIRLPLLRETDFATFVPRFRKVIAQPSERNDPFIQEDWYMED